MSSVCLSNLSKRFGSFRAVDNVSLTVMSGEFVTLLGPSGCGKTTTLRMIAGLSMPTSGVISIGGDDVTNLPPRKRNLGMVFQNYALFPHMTVNENIAFPLKERKQKKAEIQQRLSEILKLIQLPDIGKRYPDALSGGQQQRVALGRALAHSPRVLLMDEPLGALDLKLREAMQIELHRIQRTLGITTILVTHDQGEAMNLSDRVVVMSNGRIEQCGSPAEVYNRPATRFVAQFVGKINTVEAQLDTRGHDGRTLVLRNGRRLFTPEPVGASPMEVAVRPERIGIAKGTGESRLGNDVNRLPGVVNHRQFLGNIVHYFVDVGAKEPWIVELGSERSSFENGDEVDLSWDTEQTLVFDSIG